MNENPTTTKAPRKRISADERRRLLLAAALRVMRRDGVAAATTRAICAEAEMPHGAFHYCFHTKKDFYAALLALEAEVELEDLWEKVGQATSAEEAIRTLLLTYWSAMASTPDAQMVLYELSDLALRDPELRDLTLGEHEATVQKAAQAVDRLATDCGFTFTADTRAVAELVATTLDGTLRAWLRHRDDDRARQTLTHLGALLATLTTPTDPRSNPR